MPYLSRLIEQSGMVVGAPHAGAAGRTAPAPQPFELDSVRDAPPPAGAESTSSPPRPEPSRPAPAPAAASADALPQRRRVGDSPAEIVVEVSEPRVSPAATTALRQAPASMQHTEIVEVTPSTVSRQPARTEAADEAAPPAAPHGPVTLAEVRAWVAATPAPDELRLATRKAAPIEENEIVVAEADVPAPTRRATREPAQDVHLTIGSIVVTVEGPERTPAAPAPSPSRPAQSRRDIGASTRLLRHYLRS